MPFDYSTLILCFNPILRPTKYDNGMISLQSYKDFLFTRVIVWIEQQIIGNPVGFFPRSLSKLKRILDIKKAYSKLSRQKKTKLPLTEETKQTGGEKG